jgi:hypothetical protein
MNFTYRIKRYTYGQWSHCLGYKLYLNGEYVGDFYEKEKALEALVRELKKL